MRALGVLGANFTKAAKVVKRISPLLFFLLGFTIALLAVAALPLRFAPSRHLAAGLAQSRSLIAVTGAVAFVAVALAYALR